MSVHRLRKYNTEDPFTRVPNAAVNDDRLDLKSRGLLLLMLSKPDGWTFRERNLAQSAGVGRDQLRAAMKTLMECGYVVRKHETQDGKPPVVVTEVYDSPEVGKPEVGKPDRRETLPISNEVLEVTNDSIAAAPRQRKPDLLWDAMVEVCGVNTTTITKNERGRINEALKQLREVQANPDDIRRKAAAYRKTWPDVSLTATALVSHWSTLESKPGRVSKLKCECGQPFDAHDEEFHGILLRGGY